MPKKLTRHIILVGMTCFFCIFSSHGLAGNITQNLDYIDTTDDVINELEIDNNVNDNFTASHNLPNAPENLELKRCEYGNVVALNKITAKSKELSLSLKEPQYFGNIQIKLHKCLKNSDPYNEDNYMLLTITEYKIDEDPIIIFQGWLISSSISISTFEHPIYEIFAKNCL